MSETNSNKEQYANWNLRENKEKSANKEIADDKEIIKTGDFGVVVSALGEGMWGVYSGDADAFGEFRQANNPNGEPCLFIATHSWGGRGFKLEDGVNINDLPFFEEPSEEGSGNGWHMIKEKDIKEVEMSSASSGTRVTAIKEDDGTWSLTLDVPIEDGKPYHGAYWSNFQEAKVKNGDLESFSRE